MRPQPLLTAAGLARGVVFLLLACLQAGCAITAIWAEPSSPESYMPELVGAARADPGRAGPAMELIVRYHTAVSPSINHDYYVAVPLTDGGAPPSFLAYTGSSRTPREIEAEMPKSRLAEVAHYVFPRSSYDRAQVVLRSERYVPFATAPVDAFGPEIGAPLLDARVVIMGYRPNGTPVGKMGNPFVELFPDGCHLLLLPASQPRPTGERLGATTLACALTPFAVAFDILSFPVQAVYVVTHR